MDKYKVKINPKAAGDIDRIYGVSCRRQNCPGICAKRQAERLKTAILKLDTFPQSHQRRLEGCYAEKGYRQLIIDNYIAVFRIDEDTKTVTVVTVRVSPTSRFLGKLKYLK